MTLIEALGLTADNILGLMLAAIAGAAVVTALVIVVEGIRDESADKARHRSYMLAQAEELNRNLAAIANRDQPPAVAGDDTDPFFGLTIVRTPRTAR